MTFLQYWKVIFDFKMKLTRLSPWHAVTVLCVYGHLIPIIPIWGFLSLTYNHARLHQSSQGMGRLIWVYNKSRRKGFDRMPTMFKVVTMLFLGLLFLFNSMFQGMWHITTCTYVSILSQPFGKRTNDCSSRNSISKLRCCYFECPLCSPIVAVSL